MDPRRIVGSGVAAPPLALSQRVEGSLGRWLVGEGLDQAGSNGAGPAPAAHEVAPAEQRRLEGKRIEPPHAPLRVDPAQVDAVGTGSRHRAMLPAWERIVAGEGLETVLSLRAVLPRVPVVVGLSANHLAALELPGGVQRLY